VKEEATKRFDAWKGGDDAALPPYLRRVVFGIVLGDENVSDEDYNAVVSLYKTSQSADGKELALQSIGDVTRPELVKKTIDLVLSGDIAAQDIDAPCSSLAQNTKTRDIWWETMKQHWAYEIW